MCVLIFVNVQGVVYHDFFLQFKKSQMIVSFWYQTWLKELYGSFAMTVHIIHQILLVELRFPFPTIQNGDEVLHQKDVETIKPETTTNEKPSWGISGLLWAVDNKCIAIDGKYL